MIGYLEGRVRRKLQKDILLDVHGVGYRVTVGDRLLLGTAEGETLELWIHTVVREDALALYGFDTESEFELFETLLSVSGIGPKGALAIVSGTEPAAMRHAIALGDTAYLTKISGVGKKSAEKIVLELKEKFRDHMTGESQYAGKEEREALEALESLGYSIRDIREVVHTHAHGASDAKTIISRSLKVLGKT